MKNRDLLILGGLGLAWLYLSRRNQQNQPDFSGLAGPLGPILGDMGAMLPPWLGGDTGGQNDGGIFNPVGNTNAPTGGNQGGNKNQPLYGVGPDWTGANPTFSPLGAYTPLVGGAGVAAALAQNTLPGLRSSAATLIPPLSLFTPASQADLARAIRPVGSGFSSLIPPIGLYNLLTQSTGGVGNAVSTASNQILGGVQSTFSQMLSTGNAVASKAGSAVGSFLTVAPRPGNQGGYSMGYSPGNKYAWQSMVRPGLQSTERLYTPYEPYTRWR